jgi:hypothetical protein
MLFVLLAGLHLVMQMLPDTWLLTPVLMMLVVLLLSSTSSKA